MLLIFVIPTFQAMFASVNLELPLPTRIVIGASQLLDQLLVGDHRGHRFVGLRDPKYYATDDGRKRIDQMLLNAPVLGDLLRKSAVSRFTRTLGTLISSGVSILDGLEITAKTAGNRVIHDAVMASRQSIAGGETIAAPLEKSKVFPPDGDLDDRGRRADRRPGRDALQDRRLLRRRSGRRGRARCSPSWSRS